MQIKGKVPLNWPARSSSGSTRKNNGRYCDFHCDYNHTTEECYHLGQQLEELAQKGELKEYIGQGPQEQQLSLPPTQLQRIQTRNRNRRRRRNRSNTEAHQAEAAPQDQLPPLAGHINMIIGGVEVGSSSSSQRKKQIRQCLQIES